MPKHKKNKATTIVVPPSTPRNPYAQHPLMRKGGVHQKSKSAIRTQARREVRKMSRDWSSFCSNFTASLVIR